MTRKARVVDLARERRLRALDDRARALFAGGGPDLAERTRAMLAGELPAPDLDVEEPMRTNEAATQVRLPAEVLRRAEALVPAVARDPMLQAAGRGVSRSTVLRLAIMRGLDVLEADYAPAPEGPGGTRRPRAK